MLSAATYTWRGGNDADWAEATNWEPNGKPGSEDTVKFDNSSAISVGGSGTLTVAKIVTTGAGAVTFDCPVQFAGTYLVENASASPVYSKGVTATYPDDSLAGGSELNRTLPDGLTLTEDWIVPAAAKGTGNCFIVPAGAHISGQKITGESYTENQPCFRIDNGAVATFTEIPSANHFGFHLNDGRLVVTGNILIDAASTDNDWYHFDYKGGTSGTVEADGIDYSSSAINYVQLNATNYVIGAGGLATTRASGTYKFQKTSRLTATADMTIENNGSSGVTIERSTVLTIDTAGHRIQFDNIIKNTTGKIVKEGEGELVMQTGNKLYTGGTDVKGGTLTVGIANGAGNGTTTVYSGATLAFASAVTSQSKPIVVKNGGTLEWAAAVNDTSTLTLEDGAILKPVQDATFTAATLTLPPSGTVTVDLMDFPLTVDTAVSVLGGVSDASKFTVLVPSGVTGALSLDGTTLVYRPTAVSDTSDADYVWAGANGADWAGASNWRVNGQTPATAPTATDTVRFDSGAIVNGMRTLEVYKIVATGSAAVTFNCPVRFRSTYKVVKGTGAVKFPGGATATYPDASIRTSSSTDLARTLDGVFTFTEDWSMPKVDDNNHPWIIPSGSEVVGKGLTGAENSSNTSGDFRLLRVDQGATAKFTTIELGADKGNVDVNGFLEATEAIYVNTASSKGGYLGKSGNTGTVKAPLITKNGPSARVRCYIPDLIVGAGGIGASVKDFYWEFEQDTKITATADFNFLGVYNSNSKSEWGLNLNGKKITVNVPEGITVTCGIGIVSSSGSIRKTGAGTLVMTDTYNGQTGFTKIYTGGTIVDEGTLRVAANNSIGTGAVTVGANGRLEVAAGVTVGNIVKASTAGAGELYMEDGSSIALSADTPCRLASFELAPGANATLTTSSIAAEGAVLLSGAVADYSSRLVIPSGFTFANGMVYVPATDLYWNPGARLSAWTTSDPAWTNASGTAMAFMNNANATIADAATISIPSDVTANDITVSADGDVTLQDAGKIGGSGMFLKEGAGTLTFNATGGLDGQTILITNGVFKVGADLAAADALGGSTDDTPIIVKDAGTLSLKYPGDANAGVTRNKLIRISGDGYNGQGAIVGQDRIWRGIANLVLDDDASIGGNNVIHVSNEDFKTYVRNNASIYGPGKTLTIKCGTNGGFLVRHADVTLGQLDVDGSVLTLHGSNGGNTFDIANGVHLRNGAILQFQGNPANIPSVTVDSGASTISTSSGSSGATVVGAVTVANGASLTQSGHTINYKGAVNGLTVAAGTANFNGGANEIKVTGGTANFNAGVRELTFTGGKVNLGETALTVAGGTCGITCTNGVFVVGADGHGGTVRVNTLPPAGIVRIEGGRLQVEEPDANSSGCILDMAGGTLDLGGKTLTQPILKAAGAIVDGLLVVTDSLVVKLADCIAGNCLEVNGSVNLTGATLVIEDPETFADYSGSGVIVFLRPASVGSATIIGTPDCTQLPKGWHIQTSGGTARIMKKTGFTVIVR